MTEEEEEKEEKVTSGDSGSLCVPGQVGHLLGLISRKPSLHSGILGSLPFLPLAFCSSLSSLALEEWLGL